MRGVYLTRNCLSNIAGVLAIVVITGCHRERPFAAWTTGEPNAPPDVAAVYRAVLDDIFPSGPTGPKLVVIDQMT